MMFIPMILMMAAFTVWSFLYADIIKDERMNRYYEEVSALSMETRERVICHPNFDMNQFDYDRKVS